MKRHDNIWGLEKLLVLLCLLALGCQEEKEGLPGGREVAFDVKVSDLVTLKSAVTDADGSVFIPAADDEGFVEVTVSPEWPVAAAETRASIITAMSSGGETTFGLFMTNPGGGEVTNTKYAWNNGGFWQAQTNAPAVWPSSGNCDFFAYAPYAESGVSIANNSGYKLSFTVPADNSAQKDLLVASVTGRSKSATPVMLNFEHALTAICIKAYEDVNFTLHKVEFVGVNTVGTYDYSAGTWTSSTSSTSTLTVSPERSIVGTADGTSVTHETEYFMMMPQTLPSGAKMRIYTSETDYKEFALDGTTWDKGTKVTYNLYMSKTTFRLQITDKEIDYQEQYIPLITVTSQKATLSSTSTFPWKLQYSYDQTNWFDKKSEDASGWIKTFSGYTKTGPSDTETISDKITASQQAATGGGSTGTGVPSGGSTNVNSPIDLSTGKNLYDSNHVNTANCYVVNKAGWYCFPLVWGNAIKDGAPNPESGYTQFADITGGCQYISDAWDSNAKYTIRVDSLYSWTRLIWYDRIELNPSSSDYESFKNVRTIASGKYIEFYVPVGIEGNFVIGLKSSKASNADIIWSWHIWVTTKDLTPVSNGSNLFMPVNLGQISFKSGGYGTAPRKVHFRAVATDGSGLVSNTDYVEQGIYTEPGAGFSTPQYQWGRPTPFAPSFPDSYKTYHGMSGSDSPIKNSGTLPADAFKYPGWFYTNWNTYAAQSGTKQLWGGSSGVKTIFDPCPVGFRVPTHAEMNTFYSYGRGDWSTETNGGGYFPFKNLSGASLEGLRVAEQKTRQADDGLLADEEGIGLWTATVTSSNGNAYALKQLKSGTNAAPAQFSVSTGFNIRPVKESTNPKEGDITVNDPTSETNNRIIEYE